MVSTFHIIVSLYWMFNVQATDIPECEFDLRADEEITAENKEKNRDGDIPVEFTCYEMLMDANPNPDLVKPIGKDCPFVCSYLFL